jgi:hypothetical protein
MKVSKSLSSSKVEFVDTYYSSNIAIADADEEISKAVRQIKKLRQPVLIFQSK